MAAERLREADDLSVMQVVLLKREKEGIAKKGGEMKAVKKTSKRTARRAFAAGEFRRLVFDGVGKIEPRSAQSLYYKFLDGHSIVMEWHPRRTENGTILEKFTAGYREADALKSRRDHNLDHARKLIREFQKRKAAR